MKHPLPILALASAFSLGGCGQSGILRVVLYTQEDAEGPVNEDSEHAATVEEAVGMLGYDVRWTDRRRGAVVLELFEFEVHDGITGRRLIDRGCYRAAWAIPYSADNVAHELGHTLGLEHIDDPDNMMFQGDARGAELTTVQQDTIDRNANYLGGC